MTTACRVGPFTCAIITVLTGTLPALAGPACAPVSRSDARIARCVSAVEAPEWPQHVDSSSPFAGCGAGMPSVDACSATSLTLDGAYVLLGKVFFDDHADPEVRDSRDAARLGIATTFAVTALARAARSAGPQDGRYDVLRFALARVSDYD